MTEHGRAMLKRLHTCMGCDWYRDVVTGPVALTTYDHKLHGRVTYSQGAEMDVKAHDCAVYMHTLKMLKSKFYFDTVRENASA